MSTIPSRYPGTDRCGTIRTSAGLENGLSIQLKREDSVADPGCLSRIRIFAISNPNFFIPDPGSKRFRIQYPHQRIQVFLTLKLLSSRKNKDGKFIPDPVFFSIRDPQHWRKNILTLQFTKRQLVQYREPEGGNRRTCAEIIKWKEKSIFHLCRWK